MDTPTKTNYRSVVYIGILLLACVFGYLYWNTSKVPQLVYTTENTPNSVLEKKDAAFRQAQAASRLGNYSEAATMYQDSLSRATDNVQKSQIRYKIASVKDLGGAQIESIPIYKDIIADTSVTALIRAYSVYRLGRMYLLEPRDETFTAIFSASEPYHSFLVEGDRSATLKNLHEYAISLYPLALPELYSASWYADQLIAAKQNKISLTQELKDRYLTIIRQRIALAKVDIDRIIKDPNENSLVALTLTQNAHVLSQLYVVGEETEQSAIDSYERALALATVYNKPGEDGFTRLRYAIFLMHIGGDANIQKSSGILTPLYSEASTKSRVKTYLKLLPGVSIYSSEYPEIIKLAKSNPNFKRFLVNIGWSSATF